MPAKHQLEFNKVPGLWVVRSLQAQEAQGLYPYHVYLIDPAKGLVLRARELPNPPTREQETAMMFLESMVDISNVSDLVAIRLLELWREDRVTLEAFLDPMSYDSVSYSDVYDFFVRLRFGRQEGRAEAWLHNCRRIKNQFGGKFTNVVLGDQKLGIPPALRAVDLYKRLEPAPSGVRKRVTKLRGTARELTNKAYNVKQKIDRLKKGATIFDSIGPKKNKVSLEALERERAQLLVERDNVKLQISQEMSDYFIGFGIKTARMLVVRLELIYPIQGYLEMGPPVDFHGVRICTGNGLLIVDGERLQPGLTLNKDRVVKILTAGLTEICIENNLDPQKLNHLIWFWGRGTCAHEYCPHCPLRMHDGQKNGCIGKMSVKRYYDDGQVLLNPFDEDGQVKLLFTHADEEAYMEEGGDFTIAESEAEEGA